MKIFSGRSNIVLAKGISEYLDMPLGAVDIKQFSDGELSVRFEENIRKVLSLNPNPAKYANLMKKLQRNKKFGQLYLDAITSFNIKKVD